MNFGVLTYRKDMSGIEINKINTEGFISIVENDSDEYFLFLKYFSKVINNKEAVNNEKERNKFSEEVSNLLKNKDTSQSNKSE